MKNNSTVYLVFVFPGSCDIVSKPLLNVVNLQYYYDGKIIAKQT